MFHGANLSIITEMTKHLDIFFSILCHFLSNDPVGLYNAYLPRSLSCLDSLAPSLTASIPRW